MRAGPARGGHPEETQGGLGVGLALVRMLIERHDGKIHAVSDGIGKGSTFTIELPIVAVPDGIASDEIVHAQAAKPGSGKTYKIVTVDDDDDARSTLEQLLKLDGHELISARDGIEGYEKIIEHRPDISLVDLSMPGMGGIELARKLLKQDGFSDARLIALTGHGQPHDVIRTQEAGFSGHLTKPIEMDELETLLEKILGE